MNIEKLWYIWHFYIYPVITMSSPHSEWGIRLRIEKLEYDDAQSKKPSTNKGTILLAVKSLNQSGIKATGFQIDREVQRLFKSHFPLGYGTLYLALDKLVKEGLLTRSKDNGRFYYQAVEVNK